MSREAQFVPEYLNIVIVFLTSLGNLIYPFRCLSRLKEVELLFPIFWKILQSFELRSMNDTKNDVKEY